MNGKRACSSKETPVPFWWMRQCCPQCHVCVCRIHITTVVSVTFSLANKIFYLDFSPSNLSAGFLEVFLKSLASDLCHLSLHPLFTTPITPVLFSRSIYTEQTRWRQILNKSESGCPNQQHQLLIQENCPRTPEEKKSVRFEQFLHCQITKSIFLCLSICQS